MNTKDLHKRIFDLEHELNNYKSGNLAKDLHEEIIFRHAIEKSVPSGISVSDASGKKVYVNQSFCNLVGYGEAELLNKYPPFDHWPLAEKENIAKTFQLSLENKTPTEGFELVFSHKSGKLIPVQVMISSFTLDSKTYWLANVIDITYRKQAELLNKKNKEILHENEEIVKLYHDLEKTTASLKENEESYRILVENAPEALVVIDLEIGKFVSASESAMLLFKMTKEELMKIGVAEISPEKQADGQLSSELSMINIQKAVEGEKPKFEWNHMDSNGKIIPCEVQLVRLPSENKILIRGSVVDITDRKRDEEIRHESEERLKEIFKTLIEGVALNEIIFDKNGAMIDYKIIEVNDAFYQIGDYNRKIKVIGSLATDVFNISKENIQLFLNNHAKVTSTTHFESYRPDSNKYFIVSSSPFKNNRFVTSFHDITEYKNIEKGLIDGENFLKETQLIANLGTYHLDLLQGKWTSSEVLDEIFGIDELFDRTVESWSTLLHPDWQVMMNDYFFNEVIGKKMQFNKEYKIVRINDKAERWIHGIGQLKYNEHNDLIAMVGTIKDITDRKLLEIELINAKEKAEKNEKDLLIKNSESELINEKLKQINQELLEASQDITERKITEAELVKKSKELALVNKELEQFVYVASHDLQEPLRTISNFVNLLDKKNKGRTEEEINYFKFILKASSKMQSLIKDLLDFSRIGKKIKLEFLDCNEILKDVLDEISTVIKEREAKIHISALPKLWGNEIELKHLFQNLISNAIKFQKANVLPEINIDCVEKETEYLFSIKDNGIGIDQQYNNRIFIIFQRLHNDSEYLGTGIGLATCKKIVAQHNGKIWVESNGGDGSTFYFTISKDIV